MRKAAEEILVADIWLLIIDFTHSITGQVGDDWNFDCPALVWREGTHAIGYTAPNKNTFDDVEYQGQAPFAAA
jgi:hypothetical protein